MSGELSALKDRIAQAIYVLGALLALAALAFGLIDLVLMPFSNDAFGPFIAALVCYGAGWGMRWIINGTSTSVFSYLGRN